MRAGRAFVQVLAGLALLWSAPASSELSIGAADGWYKWQVEGAATTLYLHQERGKPTGIRMFSPDCRLAMRGISGEITDMGSVSVDDSVALLLRIARDENFDMDLRQQALFGLAQSDSDTAYAYLDQVLFGE